MTVKEAATSGGAVRSLALGRAAQELGLKRGELDLAVRLGHVRATPGASGGPPRIDRQEVDRLRAADGFPDALRERVRTVGTMEGAELVSISPARFTRLARTGHFTPVRFYLTATARSSGSIWPKNCASSPSPTPHSSAAGPRRRCGPCSTPVRTGALATGGAGGWDCSCA